MRPNTTASPTKPNTEFTQRFSEKHSKRLHNQEREPIATGNCNRPIMQRETAARQQPISKIENHSGHKSEEICLDPGSLQIVFK